MPDSDVPIEPATRGAVARAMDRLTNKLHEIDGDVEQLREDLDVERLARITLDRLLRWVIGIGVVVGLAVGVLLYVALTNRSVLSTVKDSNSVLLECTTPSPIPGEELDDDDRAHECYDNGREQTADAITSIIDGAIFAAECFAEHAPDIRACTYDKLAAAADAELPP